MGNALTAESKTKLERLAAIQREVKGAGREVRRRLGRQHVKQRMMDTRMSMLMGNVVPHGAWVLEDKKQRLALDIARMREDTSMLNQSLCMIDTAEDAIGKLIATEHNKAVLAGVASGLQRIEQYEQRLADIVQASGGAQARGRHGEQEGVARAVDALGLYALHRRTNATSLIDRFLRLPVVVVPVLLPAEMFRARALQHGPVALRWQVAPTNGAPIQHA